MWIWAITSVRNWFWVTFLSEEVIAVSSLSPDTYLLTVSVVYGGFSAVICPVAPKSHSQMVEMETTTSAGYSISGSCRNSIAGRTSTSEIAAELRPPHTCDLRTMEVVGSKRLTSLMSPRASDRTRRSPVRKLTCLAGCYDLGYLLERFPWFSRTFLQLQNRLKAATSTATTTGWNSNLWLLLNS